MSQHPTSVDGADYPPSAMRAEPDAHGQAALLLAEATLHALVEAKALSIGQALAVVETAAEVKEEVAEAAGESKKRMMESIQLLFRIGLSLRADGESRDGAGRTDGYVDDWQA